MLESSEVGHLSEGSIFIAREPRRKLEPAVRFSVKKILLPIIFSINLYIQSDWYHGVTRTLLSFVFLL